MVARLGSDLDERQFYRERSATFSSSVLAVCQDTLIYILCVLFASNRVKPTLDCVDWRRNTTSGDERVEPRGDGLFSCADAIFNGAWAAADALVAVV